MFQGSVFQIVVLRIDCGGYVSNVIEFKLYNMKTPYQNTCYSLMQLLIINPTPSPPKKYVSVQMKFWMQELLKMQSVSLIQSSCSFLNVHSNFRAFEEAIIRLGIFYIILTLIFIPLISCVCGFLANDFDNSAMNNKKGKWYGAQNTELGARKLGI